jgi:DinB superfamily
MLRDNAGQWRELLAGPGDLRRRPRPDAWSPLEYACHVRDVFRIYLERLELMLTRDDPAFPNWDQDATAVDDRYGEQDPEVVSGELVVAADRLADAFAGVTGEQWQRTGRRGDGAHFTVESFGRYFIHDPIHHLYDVTGRTSS